MKSRTGDYEAMNPEAFLAWEAKKLVAVARRKPVTILQATEGEGQYPNPSAVGDVPFVARVSLRLEPGEKGTGIFIISEIAGASLPPDFLPGVRAGVLLGLKAGQPMVAGPVTDLTVRILGGSAAASATHVLMFKMAGLYAVIAALKKAEIMPLA